MGKAVTIASGLLAGTATKVARSAARRAMQDEMGAPRLPRRARRRNGIAVMLGWAVAVGVMLAIADVLRQQRQDSAPR